ncbi:predicted protein [Naegleria gruberi]|uniref:Predicted protein n=1 Tax=Naegleria gruberi TaxID=5762 RepID=D2VI43_NAEGR|nr:uncharacterized protein NAEGRDRAFT_68554 [Naegleria gruberi]EFC43451.1 predicted protein [Naegleria gruberi]|eukprot:XP_002676195.1 predicted protein [Naegleria gruberi strain NEG-M]
MTVCGEVEAIYPWKYVHHVSGELLVKTIREQYKLPKLDMVFLNINTSEGYFYSMRRAVDSALIQGYCDVAVASTNWDSERAKVVHFQCAYASSYFGFVRSELDPQIKVRNETDLNRPGFNVVVSIGTITDTWATNNLKKANIIRLTTYEEAFQMILQKQVHTFIADSLDMFLWLSQNRNNCSTCYAIDVATAIYTRSDEWRRTLEDYKIIFKAPECSLTAKDFPSNLNFSRDYMTVCGEVEAVYPWKHIHHVSGELLVKTIREQYKLPKLDMVFLNINTSEGYFYSLRRAVDSGYCDVVVASTNWDSERAKAVHFQCAYASSYFGFVRSELDPQINVRNDTEMDRAGFNVSVSIGTITDKWATNNLKKANIIRLSGYEEAFQMILQKQTHTFIADSLDLFLWLSQNKNNCSTCYVRAFGVNFPIGSFVSNNLVDTSSASTNQTSIFLPLFHVLIYITLIICF